MPSVDNAATYFSSPTFLWQQQNPLAATYFESPAFLWQQQNPLTATYFESPPFLWPSRAGGTTVYYYQRVFSSGLNTWCYYTTQNGIDAAPLSAATSPNWTGSIAAYELITTSAV